VGKDPIRQIFDSRTPNGFLKQLQQLPVDSEGSDVAISRRHRRTRTHRHPILLAARQRPLLPQRRLFKQVSSPTFETQATFSLSPLSPTLCRLPNGHINFEKFWQLAKQVTEFINWKQVTCPFEKNDKLIHYLQTTSILNENTLALGSFECEPPDNNHEKDHYKLLKSEYQK
jgi:hypothetical protein